MDRRLREQRRLTHASPTDGRPTHPSPDCTRLSASRPGDQDPGGATEPGDVITIAGASRFFLNRARVALSGARRSVSTAAPVGRRTRESPCQTQGRRGTNGRRE